MLDIDGYESYRSEEDVFTSKKGKKGRGAAKKKGRTLLKATVSQDSFFGDDDVVPDSPEPPASSDESFSSGTDSFGFSEFEVDCEDSDEDKGGNSRASTPELSNNKTEECFAYVGRLDVVLSKKPFQIPYYRFVSKTSPGANTVVFYSMFYSFPSQTIFHFILLLFYNYLPTPSFMRPGKCYAPFTMRPRAPNHTNLRVRDAHFLFFCSQAFTRAGVKTETAEASCSENNVDFRILRDCLASFVSGSSTPSKTEGGMDLVLPPAGID